MAEYKGIDLLDFLVFTTRKRKFIITLVIVTMVVAYLLIYFLIPPKYDSSSTIISVEESKLSAAGLLSETISNIPIGSLGLSNITSAERYNFFNTIIYSNIFLSDVIDKFNLMDELGVEDINEALKIVEESITSEITEEGSFKITVRASSPERSVDMTNYIVKKVNEKVIELNTQKSRENKAFLEQRYNEIRESLYAAEDSLRIFQDKYGLLLAEDQIKATIESYTQLETELAKKQIELSVYEKLLGADSPQTNTVRLSVQEYEKKIKNLKSGIGEKKLLLSITSLPENAQKYLRYYRNVEINNAMLNFIIPLYEQAKFETVKNIPVLQIIDPPIKPTKKSYPPRTLFTLLVTIFVTGTATVFLFIKERITNTNNPKLKYIQKELFTFRRKK